MFCNIIQKCLQFFFRSLQRQRCQRGVHILNVRYVRFCGQPVRINILKENDLSDVEVLKNEEEYVLVNFYFDFDKDLQDAAKAYANSESNEEEFSNAWYNEYYFPYLYDFANDEVLEVIEQVIETLDVEGEMMAFQMTEKTSDYVQVMALFTEEDSNVVIEDVVREYIAK